ncbi:MAG: F0F1 ATP synthase subunit delta, partial [Eubacterium sp.]|nr:F0F1 ATP synthase subunit delta [Eubacterium sp.]
MTDNKEIMAKAVVTCVTEPDERQLEGLQDFVCKKTGAKYAELEIVKDESLIGGFIIKIGNKQYDRSLKTKLEEIKNSVTEAAKQNSSADAIIPILKEKIEDYEFSTSPEEIGNVESVGDGIAFIKGLDNAMYGEILVFESGVKGMVQDIRENGIGCILFGTDEDVYSGSRVKRSYRKAGIPVGKGYIGRVVNALGEPLDGLGAVPAEEYRPVEYAAPSIVDRLSV